MTWLRSVTLTPSEHNGNNIVTVSIGAFLSPKYQEKFLPQITAIRKLCPTLEDKERNHNRIAALKKSLPAGIISGVTLNGIGEDNIVERNAVIAIDIDAKDNPALYDWQAVKKELAKSPYVAYAGLSVSGLGVFALIPIKDATRHKGHFNAIVSDFANTKFSIYQNQDTEPTILHGLRLDQAPSNIASKRYLSYDPQPCYRTDAQVYEKLQEPINLYEPKMNVYSFNRQFDVEAFLLRHNIAYNVRGRHGGLQYIVTCPWCDLHSSRSKAESAVFVYPDGKPGYKCLHSHCSEKHWQDYRAYYEPDAYSHTTTSFPRLALMGLLAKPSSKIDAPQLPPQRKETKVISCNMSENNLLLQPLQFKKAMSGQERISDEMIKANSAVGLLVEVLDLQIVEDAEVIPDSEFYFATHSRNIRTNERWVQKHKLYS